MNILQFALLEASSEVDAYNKINQWIIMNQDKVSIEVLPENVSVWRDYSAEMEEKMEEESEPESMELTETEDDEEESEQIWKIKIAYYTSVKKMAD